MKKGAVHYRVCSECGGDVAKLSKCKKHGHDGEAFIPLAGREEEDGMVNLLCPSCGRGIGRAVRCGKCAINCRAVLGRFWGGA